MREVDDEAGQHDQQDDDHHDEHEDEALLVVGALCTPEGRHVDGHPALSTGSSRNIAWSVKVVGAGSRPGTMRPCPTFT